MSEDVGASAAGGGESMGEEDAPLRGMRIVIGEDTWHTAISLKRTIEAAGGVIAGMASHLADLEQRSRAPCDAVIMDLNLNNQLSIDLANRLAADGRKVIVLTGYRRPETLDARVHAFLEKPCEPDRLIAALVAPVT